MKKSIILKFNYHKGDGSEKEQTSKMERESR